MNKAKITWISKVPENSPLPANTAIQEQWDTPLSKKTFDKMLEESKTDQDMARIRAISSEHASEWQNALPIQPLGLKLDSDEPQIACDIRLGLPVCIPYK